MILKISVNARSNNQNATYFNAGEDCFDFVGVYNIRNAKWTQEVLGFCVKIELGDKQ